MFTNVPEKSDLLDLTISQNYCAFYLVSMLEEKNASFPPDCQASFQ